MAKLQLRVSLSAWRARPAVRPGKLLALLALLALLLLAFPLGARLLAPAEPTLVVQRISLPTRERMVAHVRNTGRAPLTIAQVQIDSAYWMFTVQPGPELAPRATAIVDLPYQWVQNEPHTITLVTGTGATFSGQVASATLDSAAGGWTIRSWLPAGLIGLALGGWLAVPALRRGWVSALARNGRRQRGLVGLLLAFTLLAGVGGLASLLIR